MDDGKVFLKFSPKKLILDVWWMRSLCIFIGFQGYSCADLYTTGMRTSRVYHLQIRGTTFWFLKVYCEQEIADGGWTVRYYRTMQWESCIVYATGEKV